jgi:FkbM family methyltransferase
VLNLRRTYNRIKIWIADQLGLRRLFAAISYLLIQHLNDDPPSEGLEGNRRLHDAFLSLFTTLKPSLFLDIGANDGSASLAVRKVAPACVVHAFEANPIIHTKHRDNLEKNGIRSWNLAVSDQCGRAVVYAPRELSRAYIGGEVVPAAIIEGEDTGKTSLLRRNEEASYTEFEVEATTLDSFVDAHAPDWRGRTVFLWVDVEGAGDRVLAGAQRLLSRTRAIFLETEGFEFWKGQADCGIVVTQLIRAGFLPVARDREFGDKQFNILFVHQDATSQILPDLFNLSSPLQSCRGARTKPMSVPSSTGSTALVCPYLSVGVGLQRDVPVFIPCFNAVTYARGMVEQLQARGLQRLFLVDNASTYPPMREYLARPGPSVAVIAQRENKGPRDIFLNPVNFALLPQFFCITDPDLLLNPAMPEDFLAQLAALTERLSIGKAGLALDIADRNTMRQEDFLISGQHWKIWEWEEKFWKDPLDPLPDGSPVFRAEIDTTFALYNKRFFDSCDPSKAVRVAGRYTCRHLAWYQDVGLPAEEERFYREHARDSYYLRADVTDPGTAPRYEQEANSGAESDTGTRGLA